MSKALIRERDRALRAARKWAKRGDVVKTEQSLGRAARFGPISEQQAIKINELLSAAWEAEAREEELELALDQKAQGDTSVLILPEEERAPQYGSFSELNRLVQEDYPHGEIWSIDRWIKHLRGK